LSLQKMKGEDIEVSSVSVCVHKLSYAMVVEDKLKRIIRQTSFYLNPGDMCAVMGPSGAGKR
jgi:ABC-type multidrug transport system ATPase subunit